MTEKNHTQTKPCLPTSLSAKNLNQGCACSFLDVPHLHHQLEAEPALLGLAKHIMQTRPSLFSATTVFITQAQRDDMVAIVKAVEAVVTLPAWGERVLPQAPAISAHHFGPRGVFLGFDFHLGACGPQLIEINTNAGGFLLNTALVRAQTACCAEVAALQIPATDLAVLDADLLGMFQSEWQLQRGQGMPRCVAILDETPKQQYLYPEFQLFQHFFEHAGIRALIADPRELRWEAGQLWLGDDVIDLVYNRLTDFYLDAPEHHSLRQAYEAGAVVLTPHPRAHALYANKRHLALLSDETQLSALGVPSAQQASLLAGVPHTQIVTSERADDLWAQRKNLFFKPASGFGSRAAYRGDKLTRRVWQEILAGNYVAQTIALPGERLVAVDRNTSELKFDVRAYVYNGQVQLFAARLYAGQTTNFRTPGGGFAPVFVL